MALSLSSASRICLVGRSSCKEEGYGEKQIREDMEAGDGVDEKYTPHPQA